jgi:predicted GNAT family acetyltransferase
VGFISFHIETASPSTAISMYNVCVDPAYRGRGIAKRLIADGVEEQRRHAKLGSKLLLGLDVDLTTEFAAESFALYAKLGFLRGWQPCRSVGDVDWRPVLEQPASSLVRSPMADILAMPQKYLENEIMGKNPSQRLRSRRSSSSDPYSHFCMFRLYNESWMSMGKFLAEPWQPDGVMNKSNKTNPNDQRQAN